MFSYQSSECIITSAKTSLLLPKNDVKSCCCKLLLCSFYFQKYIFIFDCFLEMKVEMKIFMQKGILSDCAFVACVRIGSFSSWIKCWPSDLSSFLFASNHCIRLMTVLHQKTFFPSG